MKSIKTIRSLVLLAMLTAGAAGCQKEEFTATGGDAPQSIPLNITVSDGGYADSNPKNRATENGYTTTFTAGDQIGLYVVNPDGSYAAQNVCLTLTDMGGTLAWKAPEGTKLYYEDATTKYFAYYPYQAAVNGTLIPAAPDFFADVVSRWTPATDQSTHAKYTASDLMTGSGTLGSKQSDGTYTLSFTMIHAMALVVIETPTTKYALSTDPNYTWVTETPNAKFNSFTPYSPSMGTYRYLVKPSQRATNLYGSYTTANGTTKEYAVSPNIAAANYVCYKVDGATITEKQHVLAFGDFFMEDGSLVASTVIPTAEQQTACIGIVYWVGDITADDPLLRKDHPTCTHGLVVALQNVSASTMKWSVAFESVNTWTNAPAGLLEQVNITVTDKMQGYSNTKALTAYNADQTNQDLIVLPIAAIAQYAKTHPAPKGSSGWYWPSIMELHYMCWRSSGPNIGLLNTQFQKVSDAQSLELFYSSSESSSQSERVWYDYFGVSDNSKGYYLKSQDYNVRSIFAF